MNHDWTLGGVFFHGALVAGLIAAVLYVALRWLLGRTHAYAWVANQGLADVAIYVILWATVVTLFPQ